MAGAVTGAATEAGAVTGAPTEAGAVAEEAEGAEEAGAAGVGGLEGWGLTVPIGAGLALLDAPGARLVG